MDRVILLDENDAPTNRIRIEFTDVYDGNRNPGWTHLQLMRQDETLYMVGFRATTGRTAIWAIGRPADGPTKITAFSLNRKWDIVTSLRTDGNPQLFMYGVDAGDARLFTLDAGGVGLSGLEPMNWQGGWR
jgi:hypothetical protein